MANDAPHTAQIRRYLLGELPESEQMRFEELYFADDELFMRLLKVEAEMIECYLQDELTESERARFETHFLRSAERKQRIETVKSQKLKMGLLKPP